MVEPLKSAGDQLRAAWDNYYHVYLALQSSYRKAAPHVCKNRPEFASQLEKELAFISSYKPKIKQIKLIINRARNYSTGLAPINSLPPEILARIFHMVLAQPCKIHLLPDNTNENFPRYPDYLAQVCSLWRKTALAFRSLWCHIDLSQYGPSYKRLIDRTETHLTRAGELPIELHITDAGNTILDGTGPSYQDLYKLISRISSRTGTLVFIVNGGWKSFHRTVFNQVLFDQRATVTKLVMHSDHDHFNAFICPSKFNPVNLDKNSARFRLDISGRYIERGFALLKVLHLRGIFPVWSSTAYHGLVDLRLLSTAEWSHISEASLVTILKSSPQLQILHFGLNIRSSIPSATEEVQVNLQDLQVIRIFATSPSYPGKYLHPSTLLRLLAPGSKPLRLCFSGRYKPEDGSVIELQDFFTRSRVTRFYTGPIFPPMSLLLHHASYLERVILDDFECHDLVNIPSTWLGVENLVSLPRLRRLDVSNSILLERDLRLLLECCPTGITLYSSSVDRDSDSEDGDSIIPPQELSNAYPTVRVVDEDLYTWEDPTADWDIFD